MLVQEGERLLKGSLRRSMLLQSRPGTTLTIDSTRGSDHIGMLSPPALCGLERLHRLAFYPCRERCVTQGQQQLPALLILLVKEIKSRVVMVQGFARSSGMDRLYSCELGVSSPAQTIPTTSKVEGQLSKLLHILLVQTCFQDAPDEAM